MLDNTPAIMDNCLCTLGDWLLCLNHAHAHAQQYAAATPCITLPDLVGGLMRLHQEKLSAWSCCMPMRIRPGPKANATCIMLKA